MEPLRLHYRKVPDWPCLGWVAQCYAASKAPPQVTVLYAPKVACHVCLSDVQCLDMRCIG